jgi:transcription initiation factor IIE alpha subunit
MSIKSRRETLRRRAEKIRKELRALQEECTHPNVIKEYAGNTGGYDGRDYDSYWCIFDCPDCEYHLVVSDSDPRYRKGLGKDNPPKK